MRVLMLSLDRTILKNGSLVQRRLIMLAEAVGKTTPLGAPFAKGELTVLVPGERDEKRKISESLMVYSVGGHKVMQFFKIWRRGKSLISNPLSLTATTPSPSEDMEGRGYDLITVQDAYFVGLIGFLLARKFNIPLEVQVHGFERMHGVRERLARFVLRRADKIRVVSNRLKKFLAKSYKLKANSFYVLPVYAQMGEKGEMGEMGEMGRKRKGVPYPFTFLTVGRLVPVKNIAMQIRAFAQIVKEHPHTRLRIVGDGPEMPNLKMKMQNAKLEDKIALEGEQKDTRRFYEEADAFLLTSDSEGWGLVVLEAAGYRLPIIMTNVGLANEVLHHNKECLIIPVADEEQLYGAMKEIVERPELRARLGAAAFKAFKALPSAEEQIRKQVEEWTGFR